MEGALGKARKSGFEGLWRRGLRDGIVRGERRNAARARRAPRRRAAHGRTAQGGGKGAFAVDRAQVYSAIPARFRRHVSNMTAPESAAKGRVSLGLVAAPLLQGSVDRLAADLPIKKLHLLVLAPQPLEQVPRHALQRTACEDGAPVLRGARPDHRVGASKQARMHSK